MHGNDNLFCSSYPRYCIHIQIKSALMFSLVILFCLSSSLPITLSKTARNIIVDSWSLRSQLLSITDRKAVKYVWYTRALSTDSIAISSVQSIKSSSCCWIVFAAWLVCFVLSPFFKLHFNSSFISTGSEVHVWKMICIEAFKNIFDSGKISSFHSKWKGPKHGCECAGASIRLPNMLLLVFDSLVLIISSLGDWDTLINILQFSRGRLDE